MKNIFKIILIILFIASGIKFQGCTIENNGTCSCSKDTTKTDTIPTHCLIAYYPFNGNANDESGNGQNGVVNGVSLTNDRFGNVNKAFSFNGINNSIEISSSPSLQLTTGFTISFWTYINQWYSGISPWACFISKGNGTKEPIYLISVGEPGWNIRINRTDIFPRPNITPLEFKKWKHIVCVWDGYNCLLYIDNQIAISKNYQGTQENDQGNLEFGTTKHPNPGAITWLNGLMDDIRIYSCALTGSEIQALYHEGGWQ